MISPWKRNGSRTCDFFLSIRNEHPEQQLFCCEKLWLLRGFDGFLSPHITMKPSGSKRLRDGPHDLQLWSDHFSMMTSIWQYPGPLNIIRDRKCDFSFPAYAFICMYIYIYTDTYIYTYIIYVCINFMFYMCICTIDYQKSVIAHCLAEGRFKSPQEKTSRCQWF